MHFKKASFLECIVVIMCNHPSSEDLICCVSKYKMNILSKDREQEIKEHLSYCQECKELAQYIKGGDSVVGDVIKKMKSKYGGPIG